MILKENSHHGELYVILQSKNNLSHLFHLWKIQPWQKKKKYRNNEYFKDWNFYSSFILQNENFFNCQ